MRALLYEAGAHLLPPPMTAHAIMPSANLGTPETYLNPQRAAGLRATAAAGRQRSYDAPPALCNSTSSPSTALEGRLAVDHTGSPATASIRRRPGPRRLPGDDLGRQRPRAGRVLIGGQPIPAADRGSDVGPRRLLHGAGAAAVQPRQAPSDAQILITVQLPAGVSAYDFTFG